MHNLYENISLTNANSYIFFFGGGVAFVRVAYVWVAFAGGGGGGFCLYP